MSVSTSRRSPMPSMASSLPIDLETLDIHLHRAGYYRANGEDVGLNITFRRAEQDAIEPKDAELNIKKRIVALPPCLRGFAAPRLRLEPCSRDSRDIIAPGLAKRLRFVEVLRRVLAGGCDCRQGVSQGKGRGIGQHGQRFGQAEERRKEVRTQQPKPRGF